MLSAVLLMREFPLKEKSLQLYMSACCGTSVSFSAKMAQTHIDKTETENISKFVSITYQLMLIKEFPNPENAFCFSGYHGKPHRQMVLFKSRSFFPMFLIVGFASMGHTRFSLMIYFGAYATISISNG